jgi:hypothetical protein
VVLDAVKGALVGTEVALMLGLSEGDTLLSEETVTDVVPVFATEVEGLRDTLDVEEDTALTLVYSEPVAAALLATDEGETVTLTLERELGVGPEEGRTEALSRFDKVTVVEGLLLREGEPLAATEAVAARVPVDETLVTTETLALTETLARMLTLAALDIVYGALVGMDEAETLALS